MATTRVSSLGIIFPSSVGMMRLEEKDPMRLEDWEVTIQKMIDECNHYQKRPDGILMEWRVKLEKEPTLLQPSQIDEIVRAVRGRLSNSSR